MYIYLHGKENTVDVLDPTDFSQVKNLNVDGAQMICAIELNQKYLVISCEHKNVFFFMLSNLQKIATLQTKESVLSML